MAIWSVTYVVPYFDANRNGRTICVSRAAAYEWLEYAKLHRNFLEVVVWFGPKFMHRWRMNEVYSVNGERHRFIVYKPSTGTKFYVRKISLANGKQVGKDNAFSTEGAAQREADRKARDDKAPRKGLV